MTLSLRDPLIRVLLVLTFTTGVIDAVSFLGLGHVFTANMTGNIVMLGFGLAHRGGLPVLAPLVSLAAFVLGAWSGGRLGRWFGERRHVHLGCAIGIEVALVAAATVAAAVLHLAPGHFWNDAVIALLALAMGIRNATVRVLAVPDLTTTVLTQTLAGLAAGLGGPGEARRAAAVVTMLAGALAGALLLGAGGAVALAVSALLPVAAVSVYMLRRPRAEAAPASVGASG
jgi:uncharacterized membrane protein YoaK (UPF0700 family)